MIFEHEIPQDSKLYFGRSASIKRKIENICATTLHNIGFEEIVTPIFSYHQHLSFEDERYLLHLHDADNETITLRADSTADVVRIVTKRLGRTTGYKKWFYIQPSLIYPTKEQYQVGAEIIGGDFSEVVDTATLLMKELKLKGILQVSNMRIPTLLNRRYGVDLELLYETNIEKILAIGLDWIERLIKIHRVEDLEDLSIFPDDIRDELILIRDSILDIDYPDIVVAPLYYAKLRYYDSLVFKIFYGNEPLARGGLYSIGDVNASGFALYVDSCINQKIDKVKDE